MAKDLKEFDEDLFMRGDGVESRHITIGRQDVEGEEDTVDFDIPFRKLTVDGKPLTSSLGTVTLNTVAGIATLDTTGLDDSVVTLVGLNTVDDGLGADYLYKETGRPASEDGFDTIFGPGADDYLVRLGSCNTIFSVTNLASLPMTEIRTATYYVETNRLHYECKANVWVTNELSQCDTDAEWSAMTEMVDGQILQHSGRSATYIYDTATSTWAWHSGAVTKNDDSLILPNVTKSATIHALDKRKGQEYSRNVDGTARLVDQSRTGTPRALQPGRCFNFDGSADALTSGTQIDTVQQQLTISAWVKSTTSSQSTVIEVGSGTAAFLGISAAKQVQAVIYGATAVQVFGSAVADGDWHHIAMTVAAGANVIVYRDGRVVSQAASPDISAWSSGTAFIGARNGSSLRYAGSLFDARIYNRALTPQEIARIAAMAPGNPDVGPLDTVLHYKCDEGAGAVAYDSSGNGNDGTINATSLSAFHDDSTNDVLSFQNEVGYTSEQVTFSNVHRGAGETLVNATVTGGLANFDGTLDAEELEKTSAGGRAIHVYTAPAITNENIFRYSIALKESASTTAVLIVRNHSSGVNLATPTRTIANGTPIGNGFYLHTLNVTAAFETGDQVWLYVYPSATTGASGDSVIVGYKQGEFLYHSPPRDESSPAQDVLGNALQYTGQAPRDPVLKSPCLTLAAADSMAIELPVDTDSIKFWLKTSTSAKYILFTSTTIANKYFFAELTAGSGVFGGNSHGSIKQDGVTITDAALVRDGKWHEYEVTDVDLSSWPGVFSVNNYNGSSTFGFVGSIANLRFYDASGELLHAYPLTGFGDYHDISGNQNHGTPTLSSETAAWANTQDVVDTLVKDGGALATRYLSGEDYAGTNLDDAFQSGTKASLSAWVSVDDGDGFYITFGTVSTKRFGIYRHTDNNLYIPVGNGSGFTYAQTLSHTWSGYRHFAIVYDGGGSANIDRLKLYVNGVLHSLTYVGTIPASLAADMTTFSIGEELTAGLESDANISQVAIDQAAWTPEQIREIYNGKIPPSAYYFPNGDGTETQRGIAPLTKTGTPDTIIVPKGVIPITQGPGVLFPGQELDLSCGESDAPAIAQLSAALADLDYDQADDNESPNLFVRTTASGDDRLQVFADDLDGNDLAKVVDDTNA